MMEAIFDAFEEDHEHHWLEDGYLDEDGFNAFWRHLKEHSSLWRLLRTETIVYLVLVSFLGTCMLVAGGVISAASHHWDFVYVLKLLGYLCHLAFEVIVMKMEMRHWKGNIEASRTIIHDYSHNLKEASRLVIKDVKERSADGIISVARNLSVSDETQETSDSPVITPT